MTARNELAGEDSLDAITDALLTASRLLVAISARSIARVDETITIPQFRTLVILSARGPINVRTLAGLLHVQRSTTGRMVERLVTAGLIDRRAAPGLASRTGRRVDPARAGDRARGHRAPPRGNRPGRTQHASTRAVRSGLNPHRIHHRWR